MNPAARVVPDVPSFAVDDGFWYRIPPHLAADIQVGSIVRVPLSGRRVRGWVVQTTTNREGNLKDIAGISGVGPVFDSRLLEGLRWAAHHYVAPVSVLLSRTMPPNLPRSVPATQKVPDVEGRPHPIDRLVNRSAEGVNTPVTAMVGNWHDLAWLQSLGPVLNAGRSVLVVAASVAEVRMIGEAATATWAKLVVTVTGDDDAADTKSWQTAQSPPRLVIGTPRVSTWQVAAVGLVIVLEENRRAMKDRQTPTIHVRDVLRTRSRSEGFNLVFFGPAPGVELLASGAEVLRVGNRAWPLVEVVDRSDEPPQSGFLSGRVVAALKAIVDSGRRAFVYTHRRVGLASTRCLSCRVLRTCPQCRNRLGRVERCPRCGAVAGPCINCGGVEFEEMGTIPERLVGEINRRVAHGVAITHPGDTPITVGTERDLAGLDRVALAVAADVDGMLLGTGYRTAEDALRQLARLATMVAPSKGSRLVLQTSRPESLLVTTMRRGDPTPYLERVLVDRARDGMPPSTEMLALEARGEVPDGVESALVALDHEVLVLGPMAVDNGQRWLLTGKLARVRTGLRPLVGHWRDKGATVRVDVDPIDV